MAEFKREAKPYRVHYTCDFCEKGELLNTGLYATMSKVWEHYCDFCKRRVWKNKQYPRTEYIEFSAETS